MFLNSRLTEVNSFSKVCLAFLLLLVISSCKKEMEQEKEEVPVNKPPIADAGFDRALLLPTDSVLLDGSESKDPGGTITEWQWTKIEGPASSMLVNNAPTIIVRNLTEGVYQFELKVTNAKMLFDRDTVQVRVTGDPIKICINNRPEVNAQLVPFGTLSKAGINLLTASAANKIFFSVANGTTITTQPSTIVDVYDISTQSWSTVSLNSLHADAAITVHNNKIYFGGGGYYYDDYYSTVQVYDAVTNTSTWSNLSVPKSGVAIAAVGNKVLFAGGVKWGGDYAPNNVEDHVEIYDVLSGTWANVILSEPRAFITAVTVDQKVYFAGGSGYYNGGSNTIDIYDNATSSWSTSTLQYLSTANGVIAAGNKIFWKDLDCNVEIMNITTGVSSLASLSRTGQTINVLKDDKVVFIRPGSKYFDIYNTTSNEWSVGVLPQPLSYGISAISVNNIIYIAGGTVDCTPIPYGCVPVYTNQIWKMVF